MADSDRLVEAATKLIYKPYAFTMFAYPWGKGVLSGMDGPDTWQKEILQEIGTSMESAEAAIREACASGHGIGKTALIAWIINWFMTTRPHPQVVVTANTQSQLTTKTWRELAKWHKLSQFSHWFKWTATKFYHVDHPETWCANAIPWSVENSEAFAGTHEKHVLVLMDESSKIEDVIWEVTEGAMTSKGALWVAFGNPTRNTGRFRECFAGGRHHHRWKCRQIDSRSAKMANKAEIEQWIRDYGEDSDFVRVRVKGEFPRASSMQFIGQDIVSEAQARKAHIDQYHHMPKIIGVDVARYGDDQTVICRRQGIASFEFEKHRELDNMTVAGVLQRYIREWKPDMVFVDEGGGQGVIDRLRQLGHTQVIGIQFGSKAPDKTHYANMRAYMWGRMKDWLKAGGTIPIDRDLAADLVGPEYGFNSRDQVLLEKKEDMKKRGLSSPDCADALALTFAMDVMPKTRAELIAEELDLPEKEFDPLNWGMDLDTAPGWNPLNWGMSRRR